MRHYQAMGKQDTNTLRRVQTKMNREVAVAAAACRKAKAEQEMQEFLESIGSAVEFMTRGPNFQRFAARSEVKAFVEDVTVTARGIHSLMESAASYLMPLVIGVQGLRNHLVIDASAETPRLAPPSK